MLARRCDTRRSTIAPSGSRPERRLRGSPGPGSAEYWKTFCQSWAPGRRACWKTFCEYASCRVGWVTRGPLAHGRRVNPFYHRIYKVVRHIPKGRVATYGLVARLAGRPGAARTVGWALSALPEDSDVPWWRVLNAAGRISLSGAHHASVLQRALLLREGVKFAPGGAVNLATFGWPAEAYDTAVANHRAASARRSRRLRGSRT